MRFNASARFHVTRLHVVKYNYQGLDCAAVPDGGALALVQTRNGEAPT